MYNDVSDRTARLLYEKLGATAVGEAAQKAMYFERTGDEAQARLWRRVEAVLREMCARGNAAGSE